MNYPVLDSLQPRTFIYAVSNADALVVQSATEETKIAFINTYGGSNLDSIHYLSASNDFLHITRNNSNIATFAFSDVTQSGITTIHGTIESSKATFLTDSTRQVVFKDYGINDQFAGIGYAGGALQFQIPSTASAYTWAVAQGITNLPLAYLGYDTVNQEPRLGIGTQTPTHTLDVQGDMFVTGTTYTSNLHVLGETVILNTITSNTEEMVITNSGPGPALSVRQYGPDTIMEVYNDSNLTFVIQQGNVGIGTTFPRAPLDVEGSPIISGNLGIGTMVPTQRLHVYGNIEITGGYIYKDGHLLNTLTEWIIDPVTSNVYYPYGNVGVGSTYPTHLFDVMGSAHISQQLILSTSNLPPLSVQSTQRVDNLNVQYLDGKDRAYYTDFTNFQTNLLNPYQGGTGSNLLSYQKLMVGQGPSNAVITPQELHWDDLTKRLGLRTSNPQETLHLQDGNALIQQSDGANSASIAFQSGTTTRGTIDLNESTQDFRMWAYNEETLSFGTSNTLRGLYYQDKYFLFGNQRIVGGTFGIGSTETNVTFELHATDSMLIPAGTSSERPTGVLGYMRYNTETSQFEGFGAGNQWGSLGGVKNVAGDTYILADYSPGNDDKALHFYTSNLEQVTIDSLGNVGIGSTAPQVKLVVVSSDAIQLPRGTSTQRPTPGGLGYIRYNTDTSQFEGFGAGNQWGSLGGVKNVAGDTYILADYSPGNDDKALHFYTSNLEQVTIDSLGNVGIGSTAPQVKLVVVSSDAIQLPRGTSTQRPTPGGLGYIRYNTDTSQFEGFGAGNQWGSLGGVKNVAGDTYILADYSPGNDDKALHFYSSNLEQVTIDSLGNVGIGSTAPQVKLVVVSSDAIQLPRGTSTQRPTPGGLGYIRYNTDTSQFEGFGAGNQWGSLGGVKSVAGDTYILAEYSPGNDDKALHFYTSNLESATLNQDGNLGIGTTLPTQRLDVRGTVVVSQYLGVGTTSPRDTIDIVGGQLISGNLGIGTTVSRQKLDLTGGNAVVTDGYVGVGTLAPRQAVDIQDGSLIITGTGTGNAIGVGTTIPLATIHLASTDPASPISILLESTDQNLLTTTHATSSLQLGASTQPHIQLLGSSYPYGSSNGAIVMDYLSHVAFQNTTEKIRIDASGNLGIGTTAPRQLLDLSGGSAIISNSLGIGTTAPLPSLALHIQGSSYLSTNLGIGTTAPRQLLDLSGGSAIISNSLGIGTTAPLPSLALHIQGSSYLSANLGIGTTAPRQLLDLSGGSAIISNSLGVGTTEPLPSLALHIQGSSYLSANLGIGTTAPRQLLDLTGGNAIFSGNLGIGTNNPLFSLDTRGDIYTTRLWLGPTSTPSSYLTTSNAGSDLQLHYDSSIQFAHIPTQTTPMVLNQGNLGIGTTEPRSALDIYTGTALFGNIGVGADTITSRLGIGTTTPRQELDAVGNTILNGMVGINTITPYYPLQIHSAESVLTSAHGKLAISKGIGISPTTDLEIVNSSNESYTGILLRNNGNVYPSASLRVQSHRWDNDPNPAYAGTIGLARFNNNTYQRNGVPLGAIHFGGNQTDGTLDNIRYGASIQGIAEADFTSPDTTHTGLVFYTGSNGYIYTDTTSTLPKGTEQMRISSVGNVGIHTSTPRAVLDIVGNTILAGNLGIGTTLPTYPLEVHGTIYATTFAGKMGEDLVPGSYLTGSNYNGSAPMTWSVDGTTTATANKVAVRDASAYLYASGVGIGTTVARQSLDIVGDTILTGNLGIGTTIPGSGVNIYQTTNVGTGLSGVYDSYVGGPFWKQRGWNSPSSSHTIAFPEYCVADNSSGTITIQVKSSSNHKMANVSLSFLKKYGESVDLFTIYYHKTDDLITLTVAASTNNIVVTTDNDCAIAWSSMGAC